MTVKEELAKPLVAIHKPFCILAKKYKTENYSLVTWVSIWKWYWCPVDTTPCMTCGELFIAANQEKENNINLRMNQNCISTLNLPLVKEKRVAIGVWSQNEQRLSVYWVHQSKLNDLSRGQMPLPS